MDERDALVTVGVPTFQRARTLRRAIDSVLAQTFEGLELIVSDNASQDDTEAVCREYCRLDHRVRYFRQAANVGPAENFNSIIRRARGEYLLFLGDDDWLEETYVEHCLGALQDHPDRVLARGRARYYDAKGLVKAAKPVDWIESSPSRRVREYYDSVEWNEEFYGLIRREVWIQAGPKPQGLGNDILMVARIAFLGKAVTLETTGVNRATGGIGHVLAEWAHLDGVSPRQVRAPYLSAAWFALSDIAWRSSVYALLTPVQRFVLAVRCVPSWRVRTYRLHLRQVRRRRMNQLRRGVRRWSRRLDRGRRRRIKKVAKQARTARRRSVRRLRQRVGALLLRR